jgi:hypothetical protein
MKKGLGIAGYVLHVLLGLMMIAAGAVKMTPITEETTREIAKNGITEEWFRVIGVGEIATGVLIIVPITFSLGLLLMTGLIGGIIATNMTHGSSLLAGQPPLLFGIILMLVTWIGAWLRDPRTLCTCFSKKGDPS